MHACTYRPSLIIQPDNHGHFHEKGDFEESEHGRPEHLLRHVASPRRRKDHERNRRKEQWNSDRSQLFCHLCLLHWGYFTEFKPSFLSSNVPQTHLVTVSFTRLQPQITTAHKAALYTPLGCRWGSRQHVFLTFSSWDVNHRLPDPRLAIHIMKGQFCFNWKYNPND